VTPVLDLAEAPSHPHLVARSTFTAVDGVVHPSPAPRFSSTPGAIARPPCYPGQHTDEVLGEWGIAPDRVAELAESGVIAQHPTRIGGSS
jgi:alpha-methylacyl-CoA racemase